MLLKSIEIKNLLSFGPTSEPLELRPLNILIGANGSGKSNLLEVIGLLKAAPENLAAPIMSNGGMRDWFHMPLSKRENTIEASITAEISNHDLGRDFLHRMVFAYWGPVVDLASERVSMTFSGIHRDVFVLEHDHKDPLAAIHFLDGRDDTNELSHERAATVPGKSILSQFRDPTRFAYLNFISSNYSRISLYRDWTIGRNATPRLEQKVGMPNDWLNDACDNLALVLAEVLPEIGDELVKGLNYLFPNISRLDVKPSGDRLQVYLKEGTRLLPATRLSDGTLRYLCLLTALHHPRPAPLICIEEPELGLHPDVIPKLAELIRDASGRTQIVLTTHSDLLVDCFTEDPECIITCEQQGGETQMQRLASSELSVWLEKYSLGDLWSQGHIGGTRW